MRTCLLLIAVLMLFAVNVFAADRILVGTSDEDLNVTVLQSNNQKTVIEYQIGAYYQNSVEINGENFYQIRLPKESFLLNAQEPDLARVCRSIIIPDEAKMKISVIASEYEEFDNFKVAPSKGNFDRTIDPDDVPFKFGDVYSIDAMYPGTLAGIRDPYIMRDFRGTVIDLYPFQYNPAKEKLRVYTSITVEITNIGQGEINTIKNADRSKIIPDFKLAYERHFINYNFIQDKYTPVEEVGDLLIICYDDFLDEMQPFVDWKLQKGINTTIVGVSTIGNTSSNIQTYIDNFYSSNPDLAFILLVGDADEVETPYASGGSSDPSYVKFTADDYPDAIIGRFSAESGIHVETQVQRTIDLSLIHI